MWEKALGAVLFLSLVLVAQEPATRPPSHPRDALHYICLQMEQEALESGQGIGMAMVADRNGYPGPRHILDTKEKLQLSPDQERKVQALFESMHARAVVLGNEVLAKEAELERLLSGGDPDEAGVRRLLAESAALRAELRWVHFSAHLEARGILTPEQLHLYHAARYGPAAHAHD